jgi:O-antigen ligase
MPPELALSLCLLFTLYVFCLDYKEKSVVTHALWVPLIWMIIVSSRFVSQWLSLGTAPQYTSDYEEGSPIDRLVFALLLLLGGVIVTNRGRLTSHIFKSNKWILVWFLYCGVSVLWSDFPDVAFRRFVKGVGTIIMVLVVATEPDPVESFKALVRRCAYVLLPLSLVFIKYYRHLGIDYGEWTGETIYVGVTLNKNTLGRLSLVSAFFFFWAIITTWRNRRNFETKEWWINIVFLLLSLWLLRLAGSATSLGVLLIGLVVFIGLGMPIIKRNIRNAGAFIIISVIVFCSLEQMFNIIEFFVASLGRNMTFTDRAYLWDDLLSMGTNPIWGTGYDSFWLGSRLDALWSKYRWRPNESHNGYLETYLELGLIGLSLLLGIIFVIGRNIQKELMHDFEVGRFRMAFFVMFLLYNVTEVALKGVTLMWLMFLLIAIDAHRPSYGSSTNLSASRSDRASLLKAVG